MARHRRPRVPLRGAAVARRRVLVVCEGRVTEPTYFKALARHLGNPALVIKVEVDAGDPRRLVQRALELRDQADRAARRAGDATQSWDEVWCCFDVDDSMPLIPEARALATQQGLRLAMSNPCFELWLYLHYRDPPGSQTTPQMQRLWRALQPDVADKTIDFEALKGGIDDAVRRAARTLQTGLPVRNPGTEVGLLVETIDAEGRERRLQAARHRMRGNGE